ncbi:MAG: HAD-IIIC family phosphatase, partial [Ruminiclostridium sp.]
AYLNDVDKFDYKFFQVSPKEASLMNPSHRLFLENVWKAIEDSGYGSEKLKGSKTGTFIGYSSLPYIDTFYDYTRFIFEEDPSLVSMALPGNLNSMIASRISHILDLKGPSLTIDTACSSSLVAVHLACQSLRNGECEVAIAGTVKTNLFPLDDFKVGIEATDDKAKTFDDSSDGTSRGEGVVAVVFKPLCNAIKDNDNIYAVIKGSAINHDGTSIGITAPNAVAQENVIVAAWENAGVEPETIGYIEAHGTGTTLGDPIEIDGIKRAFSRYTDRKQFCAIGSVKSNIGHLDHGAGIAGFLKAVLALKNKRIPPTLHFNYPNRKIEFEESPVYVNNTLKEWKSEGFPRRCGVSAFGLSGTNCHVILEEAPELECNHEKNIDKENVLTLSAKNIASLNELVREFDSYLQDSREFSLPNICYMANTGRGHYNYRLALVVSDIEDLKMKLRYIKNHGIENNPTENMYFGQLQIQNEKIHSDSSLVERTNKQNDISKQVKSKIEEYVQSYKQNTVILGELCTLYIEGAEVEWERLYKKDVVRKVSIPTYPFEKKRCWFELKNNNRRKTIILSDATTQASNVRLIGRESGVYSDIEEKVANIWADTLGFEEININDNFYELGGDSIIATRIINSINNTFGILIEVSSLMRRPTILGVAELVSESCLSQNSKVRISQVEKNDYYKASIMQRQVFAQAQFKEIGTALNTPLVLQFDGELDRSRVQAVFEKLIQRHEAFRTSFAFANGDIVQYVHNTVDFKIDNIKVDEKNADETLKTIVHPFDLSKAPLLRASILELSNGKHTLFIDMHHIISDGTSCDILIREFIQLYEEKALPQLGVQYKDFAVWQYVHLKSDHMQNQINYWGNVLNKETSGLNLPLDYERGSQRSFEGKTVEFNITSDVLGKLNKYAKELNVTLNTLLISSYTLLLNKYTNQNDITVGTVVSGRNHPDLENMLGVFINLLPIRTSINENASIKEFIVACNNVLLGAYENQDYPYTSMIEAFNKMSDRSRNPFFDTAFIFHNEYRGKMSAEVSGIPFSVHALPTNRSQLDIKLDLFIGEMDELLCKLEYKTDLFKQETIDVFIKNFKQILEQLVEDSNKLIKVVRLINQKASVATEDTSIQKEEKNQGPVKLAISATFTAEPIIDYIQWWGQQFGVEIDVEFAAYNQVFMELLEPSSLLSSNTGINLLMVRFEDWIRNEKSDDDVLKCQILRRNYDDIVSIIKNKKKSVPYLVPIFPVYTHLSLSSEVSSCIEVLNARWKNLLQEMDNVYLLDFNELKSLYHVNEIFDSVKDAEGHVPFTDEFYAAMGTTIIRKILSWKQQIFKVVVLDCDNTLWKGVCGEEGALGVKVEQPYLKLQKFMLEKYNQGMLLTICSKNNEDDVWEVFDKNPNMLLKKEHFVNWKINWNKKSQNIRELANELNLGLNSFIFVDDNFSECFEVMSNCPEVLTIHLPENSRQIPDFLRHIWSFDKLVVTDEDKMRTEMYISERKRQEVQNEVHSVLDYLKSLELKMSVNSIENRQVERIAQLTQRTNQFNLSTKQMTEENIKCILEEEKTICWAIEVSDRFGDYGVVGAVIAKEQDKTLQVDSFLLSCRVLGRCVEDSILSSLGRYCREKGLDFVEAKFYPTAKNQPFKAFLEKSGWGIAEETNTCTVYKIAVENIPENVEFVECYYNSSIKKVNVATTVNDTTENIYDLVAAVVETTEAVAEIEDRTWTINLVNEEKILYKNFYLPLKNHSANLIVDAARPKNIISNDVKSDYIAPRNEAEKRIAEIWQQVLGIEKISVEDKFFKIGGTSLHGIQVVSRLSMEFEAQLNDIFKYDTIASLAQNISFKKDYLLTLFQQKESLAKASEHKDTTSNQEIASKHEAYTLSNEKYKELDLTEIFDYKNILITGATGYLGSQLLYDV